MLIRRTEGRTHFYTSELFSYAENSSLPSRSYPQNGENVVENPVVPCGKVEKLGGKPQKNAVLRHGFSTRWGGVSTLAHLSDLNFGFAVGEDRDTTLENYACFARAVGIRPEHLLCANQTHTSLVLTVDRQHRGLGLSQTPPVSLAPVYADGYDALVTRDFDTALVIRVADCVPILFWDPDNGVIGAAHAGWRGTLGEIAAKTVSAMTDIGADRDRILVSIGNAVGPCCYQVDRGFYETFLSALGPEICARTFFDTEGDHPRCDLRGVNRELLLRAGIPSEHIEVGTLCTCCHPEEFHSHRYAVTHNGGKRGLMGAIICMEALRQETISR